jgi:acetyl-CoA decarbonylase/synthase complex subunit delta
MEEYKAPIESSTGVVSVLTLGKPGGKTVKVGGENIMPLHFFDDGSWPNPPVFALQILDREPPKELPDFLYQPFKDVLDDPAKWARKVEEFDYVDAIQLYLLSIDPADRNSSPEMAAEVSKKVAEATNLPLIIYGCGDPDKDAKVLPAVCEAVDGMNCLIGPVQKENYEVLGKAILDHGHFASAQTPMDINLLKELNVKLGHFFPLDRIVIDPLSPALGYGIEYTYSIMERVKQLGEVIKDNMTQMPLIADFATEVWRAKQARENEEQGILWEAMTSLSLLTAGANILTHRHVNSIKLVKEMYEGEVEQWQK